MSGVEASVSSSSSLPASTPEPTALPGGLEVPAEDHGPEDLLSGAGLHLSADLAAEAAETSGAVVLGLDGVAMGSLLSSIGWGFALVEMGHAVLSAPSEGGHEGLLRSALGGAGWERSTAWAAGLGAVMLDLTPAETATLAARFPREPLRGSFLGAVEHAREASTSEAPGWAEAREEYREIFRAWSDGHAAALGGWDTPGRSEVFEASRREMSAYLAAHPDEAAVLRAHYRSDVREGFMAADSSRVDRHRYRLDAAYRAGVEHHHRTESAGDAALSRERHDIVGAAASSFTLGTFAA